MKPLLVAVGLLGTLALVGCAPKIGDGCGSSSHCSVTGSRYCDTTQPGGYCTVQLCSPDTCPDHAVCVEWRYEPSRTAETWCMQRCSKDSDCRTAYSCRSACDDALKDDGGVPLARVVDIGAGSSTAKFCVAIPRSVRIDAGIGCGPPPDAGTSTDAGTTMDAGTSTDAGTTMDAGKPTDAAMTTD